MNVRLGLALCASVLLVAGCATPRGEFQYLGASQQQVWPAAPLEARYRFAGALVGEDNFVKPQPNTFWPKVWGWITGLVFGDEVPQRLSRPQSGWVDEVTGRIFVTDVGQKAVFVFDKADGRLHKWSSAASMGGFVSPIAVIAPENGEVWVSDADLGAVVRLDREGEPIGLIGEKELQRPTGLAYDAAEREVFVADTATHAIKVFDLSGKLLRQFGSKGEGAGEFNGPTHLAFGRGELYVVDTLNSRVQVVNPSGEALRQFGKRGLYLGDMPRPKGVALDASGRVYVVESYYDYLLVYGADGEFLLPIGGTGQQVGQFYLPAGVWTDTSGRVYVADMFNGRIMSFDYIGPNNEPVAGTQ